MKGNRYSNVEVFQTGKLEWNHLLLTGPKKKLKWRNSLGIPMFIANNCIFKSITVFVRMSAPSRMSTPQLPKMGRSFE